MQVLNPRLYRALQRAFDGHVKIENHGERRRVVHHPDWERGGRMTASEITSGEYYCINCYHCYDTRQRLYINHDWGERDAVTGDDNLYLVHCFNEHCFDSRTRQRQLFNRVYPLGRCRRTPAADDAHVDVVSAPPVAPMLPEPSHPIHLTDVTAPAATYLQRRGFDLEYLWNAYGVSYCSRPAFAQPYFTNRIVIPVYTLEPNLNWGPPSVRLGGWQARCVHEPGADEPKYLSAKGMKKSRLLYGLPQAVRSSGPVAIVEGPTDVWRLGGNAVGLFGKDMSRGQQDLIARYFRGRPIVLFLDRDAREQANKLRRQLRKAGLGADRPIVIAAPPLGRNDVGDCTSEEAWACIGAALR